MCQIMKRIIVVCLIFVGIICSEETIGQSFSAEATGMESFWSFSGTFNTNLTKKSKMSFSNTARISSDYLGQEDTRMLVMSNFGYTFSPKLKTTFGGMYISRGGVKPSIGLQYAVVRKHMLWVFFPNFNIGKKSNLMAISAIQYLGKITEKLMFVSKMQSLCMLSDEGHLFSTMRFRSGIVRGKYQIGAASDLNFSGNEFTFAKSFGLFMQYQIF